MQLNRNSDLHFAVICNRCLRRIEIIINLPTTSRYSETYFPSTAFYSLLLDRYHFFMCYDCHRFMQQLVINCGICIQHIDYLLCSPLIRTYLHAVNLVNQEDATNIQSTSRQHFLALNDQNEFDVLTNSKYHVPFIPRPFDRSQMQRSIIDEVVCDQSRLLPPIAMYHMVQQNKSDKPNQTEKIVNNNTQNTKPSKKYVSKTSTTNTTDLVPSAHPLRTSLAFEETQSERMSDNSDNSNRYWAWSRQEMIHELRPSRATTNILLATDRTKSEKVIPTSESTRDYTTNLVHFEDTSEEALENVERESEDSTGNIREFVDKALSPRKRVRDWIASSQSVEDDTSSVDSYQSAAFIEQLQNSPTSSNSNKSLEITFQSDKIHQFESISTIDLVSEWLVHEPPKSLTSTADLNERIMSYNNSPRSLSSFPMGQSEYEFLCNERENIFPSSVSTDTHVTREPLKRSRTMRVVRRESPIPSTSKTYPNNSDAGAGTSTRPRSMINTKYLSDSGITDSSDSIYVIGSVSSDIAIYETEVKNTKICSKDATTSFIDDTSDNSTSVIDEEDFD